MLLVSPCWAVYSADELDQMLGPIALYPDPLLGQMLPASTFPDQIQAANTWLASHPSGDGADQQGWDPTVVALLHYSDVLGMMSENLDWTTAVGEAYEIDSSGVMASIQRLRGQASSNGALQTTPQQTVITEEQVIRIEPSDPTYIYVPSYDPYSVYAPTASWVAPALSFGLGMATGAWLNNGCNWWGGYVSPYAGGIYCGPGGNYNRFANNNININNRNEYFSNNRWQRNTNIGNTNIGNRTNIGSGNRNNIGSGNRNIGDRNLGNSNRTVGDRNLGNNRGLDRGRSGGVPTWRQPGQSFNGNNWPRNPTRSAGVPKLNNPVRQPGGSSVFNSGGRSGGFNSGGGFDRNRGYSSLNSRPNTGGFSRGSGGSFSSGRSGGFSSGRSSGGFSGGRSGGGGGYRGGGGGGMRGGGGRGGGRR